MLPHDTLRVVTTLAAAKTAFAADHPDIVLSAVVLPDGDGYQLCCAVKADRVHARPVILLPSAFEPLDEEKARVCGADAIVRKPFHPAELTEAIERAIKARISQQAGTDERRTNGR